MQQKEAGAIRHPSPGMDRIVRRKPLPARPGKLAAQSYARDGTARQLPHPPPRCIRCHFRFFRRMRLSSTSANWCLGRVLSLRMISSLVNGGDTGFNGGFGLLGVIAYIRVSASKKPYTNRQDSLYAGDSFQHKPADTKKQ